MPVTDVDLENDRDAQEEMKVETEGENRTLSI